MDYLSLKNKLLKLDDQASKLSIYKGEIFATSVISFIMTYFLYMLIFEMVDKFNNGNSIVIYILVLITLVTNI